MAVPVVEFVPGAGVASQLAQGGFAAAGVEAGLEPTTSIATGITTMMVSR